MEGVTEETGVCDFNMVMFVWYERRGKTYSTISEATTRPSFKVAEEHRSLTGSPNSFAIALEDHISRLIVVSQNLTRTYVVISITRTPGFCDASAISFATSLPSHAKELLDSFCCYPNRDPQLVNEELEDVGHGEGVAEEAGT